MHDAFMCISENRVIAIIDSAKPHPNVAAGLNVSHKIPAMNPAGSSINPTAVWNEPNAVAFSSGLAKSTVKAL